MCGIVAAIAEREISRILLHGLQALEYRGYDSAGLSIVGMDGLRRLRTVGKVHQLQALFDQSPVFGQCGIAHTRWATHGEPTEANAHPHTAVDQVAVVHNGIIENHQPLRQRLMEKGHQFSSQTDTEVIAHLINDYMRQGTTLLSAVAASVEELEGAFAVAAISAAEPDRVIGARRGSPLVVGIGIGENFLASDPQALNGVTSRFIYLEEGDVVCIEREKVDIFSGGQAVKRSVKELEFNTADLERGEYRHFMLKEIYEQPDAVSRTLANRIEQHGIRAGIFGDGAEAILDQVRAVQIIACGTSYHAGMIAKIWIESRVGIPCQVEIASEYRYRKTVVLDDCLYVSISQSGETADILAALRAAKEKGYLATLAICNVPESTLTRESDWLLMTRAGPEIGVASTKAFVTQLTALGILTLRMMQRDSNKQEQIDAAVAGLRRLPELVKSVIGLDQQIKELAERFADKHHSLFLGRGSQYPVAMEGALKLKEISYIHAEAYPAGELKHGPLALVDEDMPVIAVAPTNQLLEKLKSNIEEVKARGGELIVFADKQAASEMPLDSHNLIIVPDCPNFMAPLIYAIPLQLLAYHVAVLKGTDVDQPRNLAKSVTVE